MNVEDTRFGVAEYVLNKHKLDTIELKWGQGAKNIGGEIKVTSLERALELKSGATSFCPIPRSRDPGGLQGRRDQGVRTSLASGLRYEEGFLKEVRAPPQARLQADHAEDGRLLAVELAMAIRYGAEAKLDLLTIDGAPGGTGMSPWPMMCEWGIPTFYLQSLTYQFCEELRKKKNQGSGYRHRWRFLHRGRRLQGHRHGRSVREGRLHGPGLMIPGMVGKNIGTWLKEKNLPKTVSKFGTTMEEIFVCYEELKKKYGKELNNIPAGAIGIYSYSQKFKVGLQQLMAGSRNFHLSLVGRKDLMSLTRQCEEVTGIPFVMDAFRKEAGEVAEVSQ